MMISPEAYYISCLEGKSKGEIMKQIRSLKHEIELLKEKLEGTHESVPVIYPTPLTRINCYRDYLTRAIQAYEDAGGKYVPAKEERRSQDLNKALDSMEKLVFSIGSFWKGCETRTYTVSDDKIVLNTEHTLDIKPESMPVCCPVSKKAFIAGLKEIYIGEWRKDYSNPDVMDGTQWELRIHFSNAYQSVEISGSNAYPYNFKALMDLLGIGEEDSDDDDL